MKKAPSSAEPEPKAGVQTNFHMLRSVLWHTVQVRVYTTRSIPWRSLKSPTDTRDSSWRPAQAFKTDVFSCPPRHTYHTTCRASMLIRTWRAWPYQTRRGGRSDGVSRLPRVHGRLESYCGTVFRTSTREKLLGRTMLTMGNSHDGDDLQIPTRIAKQMTNMNYQSHLQHLERRKPYARALGRRWPEEAGHKNEESTGGRQYTPRSYFLLEHLSTTVACVVDRSAIITLCWPSNACMTGTS